MLSYRSDLEKIEIQLLLEGVFQYYGFDFRNYAPASLKRRIWNIVRAEGLSSISGLQGQVLHDPTCLERFLLGLSVNVTSMFRDPSFYLMFRQQVVPMLRTYPFLRIWHAGCSTGEEVYSMAVLLQEENLYHRCRIYATDMNEAVIQRARIGAFPLDQMQDYTRQYLKAGGKQAFSEYYTVTGEFAQFLPSLRENIVFSQHNLAIDHSFNEFNVILCRNVLIYFNQALQERVHRLLHQSLCMFGILGLGRQESLRLMPQEAFYQPLAESLYRRVL